MAKKAETLDDLRALGEAVRATEQTLDAARRDRDQGLRDVRRAGNGHTVQELANAAGVSLATAKIALRGL